MARGEEQGWREVKGGKRGARRREREGMRAGRARGKERGEKDGGGGWHPYWRLLVAAVTREGRWGEHGRREWRVM